MNPIRRAPMDPRLPDWDRDREMAAADPPDELRARPDGVPGAALVLAIVGIPLLILIIVALVWLATSREAADSTSTTPRDLSGIRAAASGGPLLGAPPVEVMMAAGPGSTATSSGLESPAAPQLVRGVATWYDAPSSRDAAAGPGLRRALGRDWRGTTVRVCAGDRCLTTRLTDWCLCSHGDRVIDLDDRAFRQLAPLSAGVVRVTVTAAADRRSVPTAPPTDVR